MYRPDAYPTNDKDPRVENVRDKLTNLRTLINDADTKTNRTTLNPNHPCDKCGEPAMVSEGGGLRCPRCWLAEKGKQIKPLDHAGYYP